jgi:hypothetical protein
MKRRSLFSLIASVAAVNLLTRFSLLGEIPAPQKKLHMYYGSSCSREFNRAAQTIDYIPVHYVRYEGDDEDTVVPHEEFKKTEDYKLLYPNNDCRIHNEVTVSIPLKSICTHEDLYSRPLPLS